MELLRDRRAAFEEAGVEPMGISRDSPWTHIAWQQALDLNFGLVSDWNGDAVRGFGIAFEYRGLKEVAGRSAFLVDVEAGWSTSWYAAFKAVHVVFAVTWIGGGLLLTILGLVAERKNDPAEIASIARQAAFAGERIFAPAGLI